MEFLICSIIGFFFTSIYIFFYVHTWESYKYDANNNCFIYKKWTLKIKWIIGLLIIGLIPIAGILSGGMLCIVYFTEELTRNSVKLDGGMITIIRDCSRWVYHNIFGWLDKEI